MKKPKKKPKQPQRKRRRGKDRDTWSMTYDCDIDPGVDIPDPILPNMAALKRCFGDNVPSGIKMRNGRVTR